MLLSKKGVVKIADFGFANQLELDDNDADDSESESPDVNCNEVSAVHGTPAFTVKSSVNSSTYYKIVQTH